jgi:predicted nucleic acid-binding protein
MKESIFVDTGAFFATKISSDANHTSALRFFNFILENNAAHFVTSDYVIFETVTLMKVRTDNKTAIESGKNLRNNHHIEVITMSENLINSAWNIFDTYADKDFSFVDCSSFAIMKERGIQKAFTFDRHFQQFGFTILP